MAVVAEGRRVDVECRNVLGSSSWAAIEAVMVFIMEGTLDIVWRAARALGCLTPVFFPAPVPVWL